VAWRRNLAHKTRAELISLSPYRLSPWAIEVYSVWTRLLLAGLGAQRMRFALLHFCFVMFAMHLTAFVLYFCTFCRRLGVFAFLCILNYCVLVDKPLFLTSINALFQEMLYFRKCFICIVLYCIVFSFIQNNITAQNAAIYITRCYQRGGAGLLIWKTRRAKNGPCRIK